MKGREKTSIGCGAQTWCTLILMVGLLGGPAQVQPAASRPGQHGASHAGDVVNFSKLAEEEKQHSPRPARVKRPRARSKTSMVLPAVSPEALVSGDTSLEALAAPL